MAPDLNQLKKQTNTVFDVEKLKLHLRDNSTKRKPTQYVVEFNYFLKRETKTRNYICFEKLETVFLNRWKVQTSMMLAPAGPTVLTM